MTTIPVLLLGDRMRHSMRAVGMTQGDMAAYVGVSRNAVNDWLNGRAEPKLGMLRVWAHRTGVPLRWLAEAHPGTKQAHDLWLLTDRFPELRNEEAAPAEADAAELCAIRDLNPEPAD